MAKKSESHLLREEIAKLTKEIEIMRKSTVPQIQYIQIQPYPHNTPNYSPVWIGQVQTPTLMYYSTSNALASMN